MIAIVDSGVGGFDILYKLSKAVGGEFFYYADCANFPYGEKSEAYVKECVERAFDMCVKKNVKCIVLACNTASSILNYSDYCGIPIIDTINALKKYETLDDLTVWCTQLTQKILINRRMFVNSHVVALPKLAEMVEYEQFEEIKIYLRSIGLQAKRGLFACTHYPMVRNMFVDILGKIELHDPADEVVRQVMDIYVERFDECFIEFNDEMIKKRCMEMVAGCSRMSCLESERVYL
jgi:glutamate racemase